ncbi:MAG TPA: FHA domain-containing protein [Gemmataceae bacterium]|nr:FHA domain-containing protein [Gemmataceae bacterium]
MNLVGLDLNASRARAVHGPGVGPSTGLDLEDGRRDLLLAVSLAAKTPVVGAAGGGLRRKAPHLACLDFLPALGEPRQWVAGRHRLDAAAALSLVLKRLHQSFGQAEGVFVTLPTYLSDAQEVLALQLAGKAQWRLLGTTAAPAAAALAAYERLPWQGLALVVDVDGHALTWSAVSVEADHVQMVQTHVCTHLNLGMWLLRLLNGVAGRCVRMSRRDPRHSAEAEQTLYDQIEDLLASGGLAGGMVEMVVQAPQWYQNLMLAADEMTAFCAPLAQQAVAEMHAFTQATGAYGPVAVVLATAAAGGLPGLTAALDGQLQQPAIVRTTDPGDFGADLPLDDDDASAARVLVLNADAVAHAACQLAGRVRRGELARGRIDAAPLPSAPASLSGDGPPRLQFRGQDHELTKAVFTLGRDPACDLAFETELYPSVSARHCEVALDRGAYLLRDRSRHGTLLNDQRVNQQAALRSGDWIRLGPGGPVLRFLGRPAEQQRRLMTTA